MDRILRTPIGFTSDSLRTSICELSSSFENSVGSDISGLWATWFYMGVVGAWSYPHRRTNTQHHSTQHYHIYMRQCIIHDTISLMTNDYMKTRYNKEIIPRIVPYIITPNTLLYIHLDKTAYLIINKHRETRPY